MIGKDDFDYVSYKGVSDQKAVERRKIFKEIIRSKDSKNWEDEFLDEKENRKIVNRTMAPLFDDKGKISFVIGYGVDITKRVLAEETIQGLNANLEKLVEEKTAKNIELSNSLRDQEKLVTIGELAAGVAHDLNTPLGAIKSGAENVKYTLRNLLNENILLCTSEELNFALNYVKNNNFDLFVGGMQMSREVKLFKAFLKETYPGIKDLETLEVSTLFVKNRIPISELITVQHIINSENTIQFLNLIYNLQIIFSFVDTISISGEKASLVVQDLRSFIKEKKNTEEGIVNLHDNIKTVLNIFNHNIKNLIELNFNVNKNLTVKGYGVRLFQLWSNLIKNAIESMEDLAGLKELNISSMHTNQTVTIIIENNGPMIQSQHIDKIFEKFYTTKGDRNGSGLGLSIVKNVLEEHEAKIRVRSNEIKTQFEIIFNKVI